MGIDCILIGFNDEKMETTIKRIEPYKGKGAAYCHMLSRSAIVNGRRMKYSELVTESISQSTGMPSDLSIYRMPNMAVHYLMTYLRNRNITVEPVNNYNFEKERLKNLLKNSSPMIVGVSSTCIVEAAPIREVVDYIRENNPNAKIVVGGPFINSINYEYGEKQQNYLLQRMGADIFIHERQGEKTLYQLCQELKKEKPDLTEVPNIIFKSGNDIIRTKKIPENICLDDEPVKTLTFYENHIKPPAYVRTALSCSLNCAFCRYPLLGGELMQMSPESIEKNLDYISSLGVKYLVFIDDSFNVPLDRFKNLLRLMIKNEYHFKWFSFFRISHSDEETYDLMEQSGCGGVLLGVESGNNTILKNMDKKVTKEQLYWGIQQLTKHNIISYASCMVGFPGETIETAQETIRFIDEAKPTFYDLQSWFYERAVPIEKEKDYYKLSGYGYDWSHKDMDSNLAGAIVEEGIKQIKNSCFMPSLSFNLWSLTYYLSQGATIEDFKRFSQIFVKVTAKESVDDDPEYQKNIYDLLHVFQGNETIHRNLSMRHKKRINEVQNAVTC
ncbi:MAG: PhpK family radical SAM P-methyltransferase [Clostridia bacterium]|nr:PhpK family radical SAM P-methyltransferase [Clostridia bacterium]